MSPRDTLNQLRRAYASLYEAREPNPELDPEEFIRRVRRGLIASGDGLSTDLFPELYNLSAAFVFQAVPVPDIRLSPEFVYVPTTTLPAIGDDEAVRTQLAVFEWNMCWEAAQLRSEIFGQDLPRGLKWLARHPSENIYLLPHSARRRYDSYAPLYHMLPLPLLTKHGLPPLRRGTWPHFREDYWRNALLPRDFASRLSSAFADLVWGFFNSGSSIRAFSGDDSLRLLAHNLDFWLPYAYRVAERRLQEFPRVEIEEKDQQSLISELNATAPEEIEVHRPRTGGSLWIGQAEAREALGELLEEADGSGRLRGIMDAIRRNRVEEDFSDRWSRAREDFERKLYRKRSKIHVKFVELDDTIPVHGPEAEVHEDLLWEDFLGILNPKERVITVLLKNGQTNLGDIARELGYSNHSPISKALARIRRKATKFLS